jgi:hypothetical protein
MVSIFVKLFLILVLHLRQFFIVRIFVKRATPSPLRLNIFRLFVILSLTQLYRYTPEIFLFSTATFKYTYRAPLRQIGQE